ncbi:MAG: GNAT family N-acetyltransferase [Clostridiaceae bacterium]|nr:GNAT family N-acetyltransferase [Clostridiaceae bacterium]
MIEYRDMHTISAEQLEALFLSVDWASGRYPEKLAAAMENFETVYTAWDGETLVGLICALDDGVMTAYIHFLLVRPEYQGQGIGNRLLEMTKETYRDYLRIVLVGVNEKIPFYEHSGFAVSKDSVPLFLTSLWN